MLTSFKSLSLAAVVAGAMGLAFAPVVNAAADSARSNQTKTAQSAPQGNACGKYKDGTKAHDDCVKRQSAKPATPAKKS